MTRKRKQLTTLSALGQNIEWLSAPNVSMQREVRVPEVRVSHVFWVSLKGIWDARAPMNYFIYERTTAGQNNSRLSHSGLNQGVSIVRYWLEIEHFQVWFPSHAQDSWISSFPIRTRKEFRASGGKKDWRVYVRARGERNVRQRIFHESFFLPKQSTARNWRRANG